MSDNNRKESVRQLQRALRLLYKNGSDIPEITEDGIFGKETTAAVAAFQRNEGLEQSGVVDFDTWTNIMTKAQGIIERISPPLAIAPFISEEKSGAERGKHTWAVYFAQIILKVLAEKYCGFDGVEINGTNDGATTRALMQAQRVGNITDADGTLNKKTWNILAVLFEFAAGQLVVEE